MHWFLKVTIIVIYHVASINCRPSLTYSDSRFKGHQNHSKELSAKVRNVVLNKLIYDKGPFQAPENGQKTPYVDIFEEMQPNMKNKRMDTQRGVDVGIVVNMPTSPTDSTNMDKLEAMLAQALAGRVPGSRITNMSTCPSCDEEVIIKYTVQPAFECDDWDSKHRVCILERNIGDTVTFYLSTGKQMFRHGRQANVTWKKEFHLKNTNKRMEYVIDPDNPPENIIVGRRGFELRISPIAETDVSYNMYSATVASAEKFGNKVFFMIRIVPIDLGFVYVGETIELNLRKFVSLPDQSMLFKWYLEADGERGTLPSNMKVSITGSSIKISELRQEQEGVLACSVYTNQNVLATKKRFHIKDLVKNKDVLQSSPNHDLVFKEEFAREKKDVQGLFPIFKSLRFPKRRRGRDLAQEIEVALNEPTAPEAEIPEYTTRDLPMRNYDNPFGNDDSQDNPNKFQELSDEDDVLGNFPEPRRKPFRPGSKMSPGEFSGNSRYNPNSRRKQNSPPSAKKMPYPGMHSNGPNPSGNEVNLDIDRASGPHKMTAEEKIARALSFCTNDMECSVTATCVKSNIKAPGFCKCLPGSNGVGIFCREDIWLSNNFDSDIHQEDYMANP